MAHYRRILEDMTWDYFGPKFTAQMALIDSAVQADPKKLYSYTLFQNNLTANVTLPYSGPAGGSVAGLQPFVTQRAAFLATSAELVAQGPSLSNVQASLAAPEPADAVWISAQAAANVRASSRQRQCGRAGRTVLPTRPEHGLRQNRYVR